MYGHTKINLDFVGVEVPEEGGNGLFLYTLDLHDRHLAH
jgi:hypothetical protein